MTDRRRMIKLARRVARLSSDDRVWLVIFLMTGQLPPADELQYLRDRLIREYRDRWYPGLSQRKAATAIASDADVYRAGEWRHHQHLTSMPPTLHGTQRGDLFAIMTAGDIPNADMIRAILRAG